MNTAYADFLDEQKVEKVKEIFASIPSKYVNSLIPLSDPIVKKQYRSKNFVVELEGLEGLVVKVVRFGGTTKQRFMENERARLIIKENNLDRLIILPYQLISAAFFDGKAVDILVEEKLLLEEDIEAAYQQYYQQIDRGDTTLDAEFKELMLQLVTFIRLLVLPMLNAIIFPC